MLRFLCCCLLCAPCVVAPVSWAAIPGGVTFELGGALNRLADGSDARPGGGGVIGASAPLRDWATLGGELGVSVLGDPEGYFSVDSGPYRTFYDRSLVVTLMGTMRFSPAVGSGLAPFLVSQTGVAMLKVGGWHHYYPGYPGVSERPSVAQYVFCGAFGGGLRGTWPRPAPGFELSMRVVMLAGETPRTMLAPRVSITY